MNSMEYERLLERARKNLSYIDKKERFEIPEVNVKTGKQTLIKNFSEIAKTFRREPKHLAKFLFKELAVPGSIKNSELVLQGRFSPLLISQRIEEYFKQFVLCLECKKPDTIIQKQGRIIFMKCEACGARRSVRRI